MDCADVCSLSLSLSMVTACRNNTYCITVHVRTETTHFQPNVTDFGQISLASPQISKVCIILAEVMCDMKKNLLIPCCICACVATSDLTTIIKFADDTVVVGPISNDDKIERKWLTWRTGARRTSSLWMSARLRSWYWTLGRSRRRTIIHRLLVERADCFRYLGIGITEEYCPLFTPWRRKPVSIPTTSDACETTDCPSKDNRLFSLLQSGRC